MPGVGRYWMHSALLNVPGAVDMYHVQSKSRLHLLFCNTAAFFLNDSPIPFKAYWCYTVTKKVTVLICYGSAKALQLGAPAVWRWAASYSIFSSTWAALHNKSTKQQLGSACSSQKFSSMQILTTAGLVKKDAFHTKFRFWIYLNLPQTKFFISDKIWKISGVLIFILNIIFVSTVLCYFMTV